MELSSTGQGQQDMGKQIKGARHWGWCRLAGESKLHTSLSSTAMPETPTRESSVGGGTCQTHRRGGKISLLSKSTQFNDCLIVCLWLLQKPTVLSVGLELDRVVLPAFGGLG